MSSAKSAASHIGRIGALAVTLGVGAALATGPSVAWADTSDTGTPESSEQSAPTTPGATTSAPSTSEAATSASPRRGTRGPAAARNNTRPAATDRVGTGNADTTGTSAPRGSTALPAAAVTPAADRPATNESTPRPPAAAPVPVSSAAPRPFSPPARPSALSPRPAAVILPSAVAPVLEPVTAPVIVTVPAPAPIAPAAAMADVMAPVAAPATLAPLAGTTTPGTPVASPALWALLAFSRREIGRVGTRANAIPVAQPAATIATAALITSPTTLPSTQRGWVTGQRNSAFPGASWAQTNNTRWASVYGTDLGIMWVNGDNGLTQVAFGDTFSGPNMTGDWRSNVLLLSDDTQLYDGLSLIDTGYAGQFIPAARNQVFFIGSEVTNIPSAAVYANGKNYVNYFSVKSWDTPGRWTTNYSAISMFVPGPNGGNWVLQPSTVRSAGWFRSSTRYRAGDQNFQQAAYVLQPESKVEPGGTRYVYAFGTPAGRTGSAFLSRVPEGAMTDLGQYEYWDGDTWVRDKPAVAAPIIGDSPNSAGLFGFVRDLANNPNFFGGWFAGLVGAKTGGNVSEMSVQYNEYLDKYVVMYGNGANNVILRTADTPEGPWSNPVTVATSAQYPGLYAPLIHPLSGTGQLTDANGDPDLSNLYWNMSLWGNYNVVLMQTNLAPLAPTLV